MWDKSKFLKLKYIRSTRKVRTIFFRTSIALLWGYFRTKTTEINNRIYWEARIPKKYSWNSFYLVTERKQCWKIAENFISILGIVEIFEILDYEIQYTHHISPFVLRCGFTWDTLFIIHKSAKSFFKLWSAWLRISRSF